MPNERRLAPGAIPVAELVKALNALGAKVTVEQIREDVAAGAPTNPDGTMNLVHYGAWLAREAKRAD